MKLLNIGFGGLVAEERILAIVSPDSSPIKRIIQEAKEKDSLLRNNKKRKEYLYYYNKRQRILNHLTAKLTQEIRL